MSMMMVWNNPTAVFLLTPKKNTDETRRILLKKGAAVKKTKWFRCKLSEYKKKLDYDNLTEKFLGNLWKPQLFQ